ncbi:hypothetical protein HDU76_008933, partial [Blyttiomyces sp. JEL0837]
LCSPKDWKVVWDADTESYYFQNKKKSQITYSFPPEPSTENLKDEKDMEKKKTEVLQDTDIVVTTVDKTMVTGFPSFASFDASAILGEEVEEDDDVDMDMDSDSEVTSKKPDTKVANVKPVKLKRPEAVSKGLGKSKKIVSMLQKWKEAADELAESSEEEDPQEIRERQSYKWAERQAEEDTDNPNFAPLVPRVKRARMDD